MKTVALDIGGVCLELHYNRCREYFGIKSQELPQPLLKATDQFERGLIAETDWLQQFRIASKGELSDDEICLGWNIIIGNDMVGIAELIREMTALDYCFIYFSDTSPLHLFEVYRKFSVAHLITGGIFSFEVNAKKPEAAMYEAFEAEYGKPDLYLDDRVENIAGGEKFGWNSHLFTGVENLRKTLLL